MKKFNGYDEAKKYEAVEKLPSGGYVLKIMAADVKDYSWGSVLVLSFDIAEGDYKDFYTNNYKNQTAEDKKWKGTYRINIPADDGSDADNNKKRRFKTIMSDFEASNAGYHWGWDEKSLKGKLIGGLFNQKEYSFNGYNGFFTNCKYLTTVEAIRENKFKVPADDYLNENSKPVSNTTDNNEFMKIPDNGLDELPFN